LSYSVKYEDIGLRDYKEIWDYQAQIFEGMLKGKQEAKSGTESDPGTLIFVEHPHVYTLGKSGSENNLLLDYIQLRARDASYYHIDRGGDITYHGPGQLVGYPIFDLTAIGIGLRDYIFRLEEAIIKTIGKYGLKGSRLGGGTGVWLDPEVEGKARKICAIGVKVSRYVTMHGFAFNINTDLSYFGHINPCGFTDKGVTSMEIELGKKCDMEEVKKIVRGSLAEVFDLNWIN
jgi:lipoyl(octanoyl) transferase